jgi:DNA polymerase III delta prime subunit
MFSSSFSITGDVKVVFIDEADYLNKKTQASLRGIIENASGLVRFILTANYFDRFTDAITSRCTPICFDVSVTETAAVINRMVQIYMERLQGLGYLTDEGTIRRIVNLYFPDLRSIANRFQLELDLDPAAVKVEAFS